VVHHPFPDTKGSFLDGSGVYRVLLRINEPDGTEMWGEQPVVVADHALPPHPGVADQANAAGTESERFIQVPADGGYTFTLLAEQPVTMRIDDQPPSACPKCVPRCAAQPGTQCRQRG
jgi:hypothetical protein